MFRLAHHGATQSLDDRKVVEAAAAARGVPDTLRVNFKVLPADPGMHHPGVVWRVVLTPLDRRGAALPIEIRGDVILGLSVADGPPVDLDLSQWEGYEHGVSRRHLCLHPSDSRLLAIDLGSTNGTHINGLPIATNWPQRISNGDILTLGLLNLRINLLGTPQTVSV